MSGLSPTALLSIVLGYLAFLFLVASVGEAFAPRLGRGRPRTLIYVLAHPSREAAKKNWADCQADPEWQKVSTESQVNGRIVTKVESVFADPADYSAIK